MVRSLALLVAFAFAAFAAASRTESMLAGQGTVSEPMPGEWAGVAQIVVNWTTQRILDVNIVIAADGKVTGLVGDAALHDARFRSNRGPIGRALNIKTDWIIVGKLDGDVIRSEGIRRDSISMPLRWVGGHFEGGLHTSGLRVGTRRMMVLSAGRMRLERVR